jgi:2-aminoadipate transaminase
MKTLWAQRYASRTQRMQSSIIRELLKLTEKPDLISFAGGLPAPEVFPIAQFKAAAQKVLDDAGWKSLQYSTTEGYPKLREMIARHTGRYGITVRPDNILITTGSQQALDLIGKVFLNPGDRIAVERPTYLGALQAWNAYQAEYIGIGMDDDGMRIEDLENALRSGPKFLYALPNFQNPSGVTLSLSRRKQLVKLADQWGVPIVEDDPYGQLRFNGDHLPSLTVLDGQERDGNQYTGNVIYLSTFSKTLAPGIRLGWIVAPVEVISKLVQAKQGSDLHSSTFVQMVAYEVARNGFLDRHVRHIRAVYRVRRDAILAALKRHMPPGVRWTEPEGGLFIWVTVPEGLDTWALLHEAVEQKVAFVPGTPFYDDGSGKNTMRLNFSNATPEQIEEGIGRLGRTVARALGAVPSGAASH